MNAMASATLSGARKVRASWLGRLVVWTPALRVSLEGGEVAAAELDTPSTRHPKPDDVLVGTASFDLSPWEVWR